MWCPYRKKETNRRSVILLCLKTKLTNFKRLGPILLLLQHPSTLIACFLGWKIFSIVLSRLFLRNTIGQTTRPLDLDAWTGPLLEVCWRFEASKKQLGLAVTSPCKQTWRQEKKGNIELPNQSASLTTLKFQKGTKSPLSHFWADANIVDRFKFANLWHKRENLM